jgi:hypothetical protein
VEATWHDASVSDTLAAFAYLWDGSQPGWRLRVSCRYERRLVLHFGASGPSVQQVAALREVFDELRGQTPQAVLTALKGKESVTLDTVFGPIDAARLVRAAENNGVRAEVCRTDIVSYGFQNKATGVALCVENVDEAAAIANRMTAQGVPVDHEEVD